MVMFVATKTITITEKAYKTIAREKRKVESFSELMLRLSKRGKIMDCFGSWKMSEEEEKAFTEILPKAWKKADETLREAVE